ncbi:hypothetical protein L195_g048837, partial [Trifolium pratense]
MQISAAGSAVLYDVILDCVWLSRDELVFSNTIHSSQQIIQQSRRSVNREFAAAT